MGDMFKAMSKEEYKRHMQKLNGELVKEPVKKRKKKKFHNNFPTQHNAKTKQVAKKPYMPYWEQLNRPEWLKRREEVFKIKGKVCAKCGSTTNLRIPHVKYLPNKYAWEYKMKYYEVLCDRCHKKAHCIDLDEEFKQIVG